MSTSIFVVSLEQDRYFIHRSYGSRIDFQLFIEFEICYEFTKLYKPLYIIEIIPEENAYHLDYIVKKYMLKYGIEHVRGGSYSDPILSEKQKEMLQMESESVSHKLAYQYIVENYVYKNVINKENTDLEKIRELMNEYSKYKKEYSFIELNENIRECFNWLREFCRETLSGFNNEYTSELKDQKYYKMTIEWKKMNAHVLNRYSELLKTCKQIHEIYNMVFLEDNMKNIYFKHPEFLLDEFFLHKYLINNVKLSNVYTFCDMMLFMLEKIIEDKKIKEMKFSEIPSIEWSLPKIQYILESATIIDQ